MQRQPEPEYMDLPEEADAYARADFSAVNSAFVERLCSLASRVRAPLALDLGVGPGDIPALILQRRPGWRIVGLDAARAMLSFARNRITQVTAYPPLLAQADAKKLPFAEDTFDIIFSNSILHHVNNPRKLWAGTARTAKPGALVFVRDLLRPESAEAARELVRQHAGGESALLQEEFFRSLLAAYTLEEVQTQLAEVGLCGLTVTQVSDRHLDVYGRLPEATDMTQSAWTRGETL